MGEREAYMSRYGQTILEEKARQLVQLVGLLAMKIGPVILLVSEQRADYRSSDSKLEIVSQRKRERQFDFLVFFHKLSFFFHLKQKFLVINKFRSKN